jgi:expansin (peptidoglycan-binding protein)
MEPTSWVVSRNLALELIDVTGEASRLDGELEYNAADPFAVTAVFRAGETPIRWVFARDLLAEGIFSPVGDGDVHVWPCLDIRGHAVVILELTSPYGEALLQASSSDVNDFLQHTFDMVPRGTEDGQLDLDDTVRQLLGATALGTEGKHRHDTAG